MQELCVSFPVVKEMLASLQDVQGRTDVLFPAFSEFPRITLSYLRWQHLTWLLGRGWSWKCGVSVLLPPGKTGMGRQLPEAYCRASFLQTVWGQSGEERSPMALSVAPNFSRGDHQEPCLVLNFAVQDDSLNSDLPQSCSCWLDTQGNQWVGNTKHWFFFCNAFKLYVCLEKN